MLVGNNVARAFSLAGAFSIIRFRSTAGDSQDMTYILYTMAIGLALGLGFVGYAYAAAVFLLLTMLILDKVNFAGHQTSEQLLKITLPEDMYYKDDLERVLSEYTDVYQLKKIKTTELGSLFEVNYLIRLKGNVNEKNFLDSLRVINGNLTIAMQYNLLADEY
jgi:uncharacterized membrane protein YhiD involved in acid resistance